MSGVFGKVLGLSRAARQGRGKRSLQVSELSPASKGKLDVGDNWAAVEGRTIRPGRGDFSEKGHLTTVRGRAAGRPCRTARKREDLCPVLWEV